MVANNTATIKAQAEMAQRVLSRRRLMPFVKRFNSEYQDGWVHNDICRRLERFSAAVAAKKSPRLMLLMPPRHGKSELASRNFPAWHMGQYPDHEFIACSYNLSLAMDFSRKVKQIITDPMYENVFDVRLDPNNQSTESWGLQAQRGGYVAAGIGGPITGKGAHVLAIDDPVKNAEEADSADTREKNWEWYLSTAYSRLAPGGGVLVIQCMTGETPVLMSDGTEKRLDTVRVGDQVATYEDGRLSSSTVAAWRSNGPDSVYKITTSSGKIVRANGRHPFLVSDEEGLRWTRTRDLTTTHKIVALPGSGGSGEECLAQRRDASCQLSVGACVPHTTEKRSGPTATVRRLLTRSLTALRTSSTAMVSAAKNMIVSWSARVACAPFASASAPSAPLPTGKAGFASTTITKPAKSVACSAMIATPRRGMSVMSASHSPWPATCEFTTDRVASVEVDGVGEVFDVRIDRTENFIANGLVSHNTWWHDDDLAGRLQRMMADGHDDMHVDQFEVIKYPAIAEEDEYLNHGTDLIEYGAPPESAAFTLLRQKGEPLHPDRYDLDKLLRIKAQNNGGRWWSALYQQNPVPADGSYFMKDQFGRAATPPARNNYVFIAWDFAISTKKQNDYTVGTVGIQDGNDVLHIADQVRFKSGDAFFIVESILNLSAKWYSPVLVMGFEDGQIYRAIESLLKKRMKERRVYPPIVVLKPITDKMARARPLQGRMQQGMVQFATGAPWFDSMRAEMLRFPAGVHDDQVDSLAWLAQMVVGHAPPRNKTTKVLPSWRDKLKLTAAGASHMAA